MLKVGELWQNIAALKRPEETNTNCSQLPRFHTKATEHFGIDTAKINFLRNYINLRTTYLPALVMIISVSSRWKRSHSSGFRRRAEIVLVSPSIAVCLLDTHALVAFCFLFPQCLLALEFRSRASEARFVVLPRVECAVVAETAFEFEHVSVEAVVIGICSDDFEIDSILFQQIYKFRDRRKPVQSGLQPQQLITMKLPRHRRKT